MTDAPPTPPKRWRARSKGVKQISMMICTTASTGVHSLCSRANSDPAVFQNKRRDQADFRQFRVKRAFQNEISLKRLIRIKESCVLHAPDRGLLF